MFAVCEGFFVQNRIATQFCFGLSLEVSTQCGVWIRAELFKGTNMLSSLLHVCHRIAKQVVITAIDLLGKKKKVEHLWKLEGATERLKLVQADLMEENSFDNAIIGCKGVFHITSPVLNHISNDPKSEILEPAVQGTLNVLGSCRKNLALVRVVLASSSSAVRVRDDFDPNVSLDESSWSSLELCEKLKAWYPMSKIMAEKAAWEYCKENGIDLVTILPSFIIGPSLPTDWCSTAFCFRLHLK